MAYYTYTKDPIGNFIEKDTGLNRQSDSSQEESEETSAHEIR